jgi:hypothetical protein
MNYIKLTKPNEGWTTDAWHRRIYMHLLSMDFWKVSFPRILYIHWKDNTKYMNVGDPWKPQAGYIMLHLLIELPFWQIFVALFRALSQWNHGFYRNSFQLYPFFTIPFLVFSSWVWWVNPPEKIGSSPPIPGTSCSAGCWRRLTALQPTHRSRRARHGDRHRPEMGRVQQRKGVV